MRSQWIKGVLEPSIYQPINGIEMIDRPELVGLGQRPSDLVYRVEEEEPKVIAQSEQLIDLFESSNQKLLIVGTPGSGKTITALQLVEELLDRNLWDQGSRIPLVFKLASWVQLEGDLVVWLIEEASRTYQIGKEFMRDNLIGEQEIILYLDGLDELAVDKQNACVTSINAFQEVFALPMIISCRLEEYGALSRKLNLSHAVEIQELSDDTIDRYLTGDGLLGLRGQINQERFEGDDNGLYQLAKVPLFLSLMPFAYEGVATEEFEVGDDEENRKNLLNRFVEKMFIQRPLQDARYSTRDALGWLTNVAFNLVKTGQQSFYIEYLDDRWLPSQTAVRQRKLVSGLIVSIVYGMIGGVSFGLISAAIGGAAIGLILGLLWTIVTGAFYGLLRGPADFAGQADLIESYELCWPGWRALFSWPLALYTGSISLLTGIYGGFLLGLIGGVSGLVVFGLILGREKFFKIPSLGNESRQSPNQGIYRTWRTSLSQAIVNGIIFGVSIALTIGLFVGILLRLAGVLNTGLQIGLLCGLIGGIIYGSISGLGQGGGLTVLRHYSLRWVMEKHNVLPFRKLSDDRQETKDKLVPFLNEMVYRSILKRVGGGWIFYHDYFLQHFAQQHKGYAEWKKKQDSK